MKGKLIKRGEVKKICSQYANILKSEKHHNHEIIKDQYGFIH